MRASLDVEDMFLARARPGSGAGWDGMGSIGEFTGLTPPGWDVVRESGMKVLTLFRGVWDLVIDSAVGRGAAAILQDASSSSFSFSVRGVVLAGAGDTLGGDFPFP